MCNTTSGNDAKTRIGGWGGGRSPQWGESSDEKVTLEAVQALLGVWIPSERPENVIWLGGESSASTVWCLRRRIRCNVGDEISSDRWSIYSSEKSEKPSQIDMEAACTVYSLLTLLPAVEELLASCCEIKVTNKLGIMWLIYSAVLLICTQRYSHFMIFVTRPT